MTLPPWPYVSGASGSGMTDDTAAIQAAINAGPAILPPGRYVVRGLDIRPGVPFAGIGATLVPFGSGTVVLGHRNPTVGLQAGFDISGLAFDASGREGCTAIGLYGVGTDARLSGVRIRDIQMDSPFTVGVDLANCVNVSVRDVAISSADIGARMVACADTDLTAMRVQMGRGWGFVIKGAPGAYDEGVRMSGCSTNGQGGGLIVDGQDWGGAVGCSFTTCHLGAMRAIGASNWKLAACEFAPAADAVGITIDQNCTGFSFSAGQISNAMFGAVVHGSGTIFQGMYARDNKNVDIYLLGATRTAINGNMLLSKGVPWSIVEAGGASKTAAAGNVVAGVVAIGGAGSVGMGNVQI